MKKLMWLTGIILGVVSLLWAGTIYLEKEQHRDLNQSRSKADNVLTIFNWGDYIDPELIKAFQKESGYQVNYETFDSNEAMFTKIKQGGTSYDIAVPSEYMVSKMTNADMLEPLDYSRLKGLDNLDENFLKQDFDPKNTYSLPYFWGTLGIVYNDQMVDGNKIKTWNDLWRPEFKKKIMLVDSARDILGMTLVSNGASVNTKNLPELAAADGKLATLMPNVKAIVADEIKMYMAQNEAAIAVDYSGNAAEMMSRNEHLQYVVPKEGGNLWLDNFVIPKTVRNRDAAYAFINFMNRPENAAQNAEYVGYATPNKVAKTYLPAEVRDNPAWYPERDVLEKLEVYQDLGLEWTETYNDYFLEFKMHKQ
ncbi:ABC transporter substrate-binding protein [Weissella tructae]|uniref:PotD protein n=2 Tax=Weissella TaxID=46255 RepID=A0A075TY38_9LACO|nr:MULTISPECIES: ABC transporter substrate-binding protein [Weissella]AIG65125.1 PotD protein [Weissella tructae]AIM62438.1 PotD protein [Weissella ceti]AIM63775.1 PotD protein [Weissella ceti]ELA07892.1 spermidine/putrescine ABC superfamily ATP binding cassette transporter, binding protein [Weissella ceti NC36]QVV91515.1 ABC transporter substrate-binding protein [Weissella tructae]